jgi:hypothetical protein
MAVVPGCRYDVFISYPREADDRSRWIAKFHEQLSNRLKVILPKVEIYFDKNDYLSAHHRNKMLEAAGNSALFLPILCPPYVQPDKFTLKEFDAFEKNRRGEQDRIVIVEIYPLDVFPREELHGPNRNKFYEEHSPYSLIEFPSRAFKDRLARLAQGIADRLKELETERRRTILIAKATNDEAANLAAVAGHVRAKGHEVLTTDGYPSDLTEYRARLRDDLKRSHLFVELLGRCPAVAATRNEDPYALSEVRYEEARLHEVPSLLWVAPLRTAGSDTSEGACHRLLNSEDVQKLSLPQLQSAVIERIAKCDVLPRRDAPAGSSIDIYIAADPQDPHARTLKQVVMEIGANYYKILDPATSNADIEHIIETATAFVLLHGQAKSEFVKKWVETYRRIRAKCHQHPRLEALVYAPPPGEDKTDPPNEWFRGLDWFFPPEKFPQEAFKDRLRGLVS